jgi:hypothetical protein
MPVLHTPLIDTERSAAAPDLGGNVGRDKGFGSSAVVNGQVRVAAGGQVKVSVPR